MAEDKGISWAYSRIVLLEGLHDRKLASCNLDAHVLSLSDAPELVTHCVPLCRSMLLYCSMDGRHRVC